MTSDLDKLIEAVEAGVRLPMDGSSYRLFGDDWLHVFDAHCGSLDAAKALHESLLPGWVARHTWGGPLTRTAASAPAPYTHVFKPRMTEADDPCGESSSGYKGDIPARAWLLAILKAYRAQVSAQ